MPRQIQLGTHYARNQKRRLAQVRARQKLLGDAYRISNKLQLRRNRQKRRDAGQTYLALPVQQQ